MNILITSAGRRVSLVRAFINELKHFKKDANVFTVDLNPELSSACRISDGFFTVPSVLKKNYCETLLDICLKNHIKIIIPTIDTELLTLAEHEKFFINHGVIPIVSDKQIIEMCRDKRKTHQYFDLIGLPRAKEIDIENPGFPFFVKPYNGSSSNGIRIITSKSQISESLKKDENLMFLEYLDPKKHTEYTIDLYFDRSSQIKCLVPRERIEVRSGEVSKGITRMNEVYDCILSKFSGTTGFKGCITLQLFVNNNDKSIYGIEINPRFGGGYPLSYFAKANFPQMIIREYLLGDSIQFFSEWTKDLLMLRYDSEILIYDYKS